MAAGRLLTWGPCGCCPPTASGPGRPRGAAPAPTCCRATRRRGRTAGSDRGWRSRPGRPPSGGWPWYSGFLFSAGGWGPRRGRAGLKQEEERRDRADGLGEHRGGWWWGGVKQARRKSLRRGGAIDSLARSSMFSMVPPRPLFLPCFLACVLAPFLTWPPEAAFVDAVLVDGLDVVLWGLEGPQLRAQVAAVGASGAWKRRGQRSKVKASGGRGSTCQAAGPL